MSYATAAPAAEVVAAEVIRERFLDAAFTAAATVGAAFGFSGRTVYETLAPLADGVALACVAAATEGGAA